MEAHRATTTSLPLVHQVLIQVFFLFFVRLQQEEILWPLKDVDRV